MSSPVVICFNTYVCADGTENALCFTFCNEGRLLASSFCCGGRAQQGGMTLPVAFIAALTFRRHSVSNVNPFPFTRGVGRFS